MKITCDVVAPLNWISFCRKNVQLVVVILMGTRTEKNEVADNS